jgi:hypothetical protein
MKIKVGGVEKDVEEIVMYRVLTLYAIKEWLRIKSFSTYLHKYVFTQIDEDNPNWKMDSYIKRNRKMIYRKLYAFRRDVGKKRFDEIIQSIIIKMVDREREKGTIPLWTSSKKLSISKR